jgi:hypothetical protein
MANPEDAQRVLEQKALTNVRGLVDKLEAGDQAEKSMQRRILIGFAVVLAVLGALWAAGVIDLKRGEPGKEVVVAPQKAPAK